MQEVPPGMYQVSFQFKNPAQSQISPVLSVEVISGTEVVISRENLTSAPLLDAPLAVFGYK